MKKRLDELLNNAYGEYSGIQVSAIAIAKDGTKFEGVNVENAAYPSGICAERNALFHAIAKGQKVGDLVEIHLTSNLEEKNLYPCAGCLQVMLELMPANAKVNMYHKDEIKTHELKELVPFGVTRDSFE